jgi:CheY-like chemotaxis protein
MGPSIRLGPPQEIPMNDGGHDRLSTPIDHAAVRLWRWEVGADDGDDPDHPGLSGDDEGGEAVVATAGPILVVEDNDDVRDAMVALLETAGYATVSAVNGQHALDVLRSGGELPCLIVLDLMMPVMDGATFRRRQLDDPAIAHIPVVVVTAYGRSLGGELLGDAELFGKPVDFERLIEVVRQRCLRR